MVWCVFIDLRKYGVMFFTDTSGMDLGSSLVHMHSTRYNAGYASDIISSLFL